MTSGTSDPPPSARTPPPNETREAKDAASLGNGPDDPPPISHRPEPQPRPRSPIFRRFPHLRPTKRIPDRTQLPIWQTRTEFSEVASGRFDRRFGGELARDLASNRPRSDDFDNLGKIGGFPIEPNCQFDRKARPQRIERFGSAIPACGSDLGVAGSPSADLDQNRGRGQVRNEANCQSGRSERLRTVPRALQSDIRSEAISSFMPTQIAQSPTAAIRLGEIADSRTKPTANLADEIGEP